MLKKIFGYAAVAVALACGIWFFAEDADDMAEQRERVRNHPAVQAVVNGTLPGESDDLNFALKDILLSQGEGGFELWRLKAEWAAMQRQDGKIFVQEPRLTYFMSEEEGAPPLLVRSKEGDVEQSEKILRFVADVYVTQEAKELSGDLLVYNGTAGTMTLPNGGSFTDTGLDGTAGFLVWHIAEKLIEAQNGVEIHFNSAAEAGASSPPAPPEESDSPQSGSDGGPAVEGP